MESPIPVRIPKDILAKIDAEGKRGTVINQILRKHYGDIRVDPVHASNVSDSRPRSSPVVRRASPEVKPVKNRLLSHEEVGRIMGQITARVNRELNSHDPKTCRVYKCGMCAADK